MRSLAEPGALRARRSGKPPRGAARAARLASVLGGLVGLGVLLGLSGLGCKGAGATPPSVMLASTHAIQVSFERLTLHWARSSRDERIAMKAELSGFKQNNPSEPVTRTVEALLAWVALEEGKHTQAEHDARAVQSLAGPGTTSDLARAVQGAAIRRGGRPKEALNILTPLLNKLIDPYAQALLNEEIVESALAAQSYDRALSLMALWLRTANAEDRDHARVRVEDNLKKVPPAALRDMLDRQQGAERSGLASEDDGEMRRIVAQRLSTIARDQRDIELAKHLLGTSGALLGDQGDAVAKLATGGNRARVEARAVGLLLSLRSDETRRRDAAVADGVAFGLGLPGSSARLMTSDDQGELSRIDEALMSLSAEGASIIIAGVDQAEAQVAARFAEANQIPVILLTAPAPSELREGSTPSRFTFVLGVDPAATEETLAAGLAARGVAPIAILTMDPGRQRTKVPEVTAVRGCDEASSPWKPLGVGGIVLNASCAPEAIVAAAPVRARLAAGFEANLLGLPAGSLRATAGLFPIEATKLPAAIQPWMKGHAMEPSYWAALGRDAAALAWIAVQVLPPKGTEDPQEVTARRAQAAQALARGETELWTSDARGFGGARVLPRAIGVREAR